MPESSLFTSGVVFSQECSSVKHSNKSSDLNAAGNEEAFSKGGHVVLALGTSLLFCKKKQAWAGAFRVYTGHDSAGLTGGDRETWFLPLLQSWAS